MSQDMRKERCIRFAHGNWVSVAGAAYRYFRRQGPGALLMDWKSVEAWENGQAFTLEVDYVTLIEWEEVQHLIESYDPERQIILFLTTDSEAVSGSQGSSLRTLTQGEEISVWIINPPTPRDIADLTP